MIGVDGGWPDQVPELSDTLLHVGHLLVADADGHAGRVLVILVCDDVVLDTVPIINGLVSYSFGDPWLVALDVSIILGLVYHFIVETLEGPFS